MATSPVCGRDHLLATNKASRTCSRALVFAIHSGATPLNDKILAQSTRVRVLICYVIIECTFESVAMLPKVVDLTLGLMKALGASDQSIECVMQKYLRGISCSPSSKQKQKVHRSVRLRPSCRREVSMCSGRGRQQAAAASQDRAAACGGAMTICGLNIP